LLVFIEAALRDGSAVIVIATESHLKSLIERLRARGADTAAAIEQGRYLSLDVAATLSTFMVNDLPDPARVFKVGSDLIVGAAKAAAGGSIPELLLVVNVHIPCGRKVKGTRRFSSNTSGTR
jgi:hypothetical protein